MHPLSLSTASFWSFTRSQSLLRSFVFNSEGGGGVNKIRQIISSAILFYTFCKSVCFGGYRHSIVVGSIVSISVDKRIGAFFFFFGTMNVKQRLFVLCSIILLGVALIDLRQYRKTRQLTTSSLPLIHNVPLNHPSSLSSSSFGSRQTSPLLRPPQYTRNGVNSNPAALSQFHAVYDRLVDSTGVLMRPDGAQALRKHEETPGFHEVVLRESVWLRTGDLISIKTHDGDMVSIVFPVPRGSSTPGLAVSKNGTVPAFSQFLVTVVDEGVIELKIGENLVFNMSCCEGGDKTVSLVEDDSSSGLNFSIVPTSTSGFVQIRASNGLYLSTSENYGPLILTTADDGHGSFFSVLQVSAAANGLVVNDGYRIYNGDLISVRTMNATFWERVSNFPTTSTSGVFAYRETIETKSMFKVEVVSSTEFHLIADNGLYLERYCCWEGKSVLAGYLGNPEASAKFTMYASGGRQVQLQAENNQYWTMYNKGDGYGLPVTEDLQSLTTQNFFLHLVEPLGAALVSKATYIKSGDKLTLEIEALDSFVESTTDFANGTATSGLVAYHNGSASDAAIFTVHVVSPTEVQLKSSGIGGGYWKWACCLDSDDEHFFIATDSEDANPEYSTFFFYAVGNNHVIIRASNGDYLASYSYKGQSIITTSGNVHDAIKFKVNLVA